MTMVTVLIPTHNHTDTIRYAIASVQAQTFQDFEILVVGDGAPERTDDIMKELCAADDRIRYFPNPKGEGNGEFHRADALKESRGEFVCYLSDDDLWLSDHLDTMVPLLKAVDFAHTTQVNIRHDGALTVLAGDLNADVTKWRMQTQKWNLFGPMCAGHTMAAYRKLPEGWRPRPEGMFSDLHMWRQWLEQSWCTFHSSTALTTLHFLPHIRRDWPISKRIEELDVWWKRSRQPDFRTWLEQERLRAWQRQSERPEFYFRLGHVLLKHEELALAEELYRKAIDLDDTRAIFFRRLSEVLMKREALDEAISAAKAAVDIEQDNARFQFHLGRLLVKAERWEEAAQAFMQVIARDDTFAPMYYQASLCFARLGRLEEAKAYAEKATVLEPDKPHFQRHLNRLQSQR